MATRTLLLLVFFLLATATYAGSDDKADQILNCWIEATLDLSEKGIGLHPSDLHPSELEEREGGYFLARGMIGYHSTWAVLINTKSKPITAYETYLFSEEVDPFEGREVPSAIRIALFKCGIEWRGVWPGEWPQVKKAPSNAKPPKLMTLKEIEKSLTPEW